MSTATANAPSIVGKPKKKPSMTIREVALDDIYIDPEYQRAGNKKKIDKIVAEWRESRIRPPMLSERVVNGKRYAGYDGQHTILAAIQKGYTHMDCVIAKLTQEEEAEDFVGINTAQTKPNTRDRFKARVTAKDPDAVTIEMILNKHHLTGVPNTGLTVLKAIGAVEEIRDKYGDDVLDQALGLAIATWGSSTKYLRRYTLIAIAMLISTYGSDLEEKNFVRRFSSEDPAVLETTARAKNRQRHYLTIPTALAEEMVAQYNYRLAQAKHLDVNWLHT